MFLLRKKTEICKNKYKRFKNENCERAKRRSAISYDTLEMIYQQLFDMSRTSHTLSLQSKVKNYKNFLSSASEFLRQATSCEYNPQWNPRIVKVSTGQLRHNCHTYIIQRRLNEFRSSCLENLCNKREIETDSALNETSLFSIQNFNPNVLPLPVRDRSIIKDCIRTLNKNRNCTNCRYECGEAIFNGKVLEFDFHNQFLLDSGEICVNHAVNLIPNLKSRNDFCFKEQR